MSSTAVPRRPACTVCLRPQSACICRWITPVAHETEVLILQHPLEVEHSKNTARLLHLSLPHSRIVVGEVFDAQHLRSAMELPKYTVLLYPRAAHSALHGVAPDALDPARLGEPKRLRLVVLDGTWRKSRKMLHLSPLLQQLPRLSLDDAPVSAYRIRRAHKPGQLSTLEATCLALMQLERDPARFQSLLTAFQGFVAQQSGFARSVSSTACENGAAADLAHTV